MDEKLRNRPSVLGTQLRLAATSGRGAHTVEEFGSGETLRVPDGSIGHTRQSTHDATRDPHATMGQNKRQQAKQRLGVAEDGRGLKCSKNNPALPVVQPGQGRIVLMPTTTSAVRRGCGFAGRRLLGSPHPVKIMISRRCQWFFSVSHGRGYRRRNGSASKSAVCPRIEVLINVSVVRAGRFENTSPGGAPS